MRRVSLLGLAICGVLLVSIPGAFGAGGGAAADPGVKPTSITIGGTFPLTGPASGYAPIPGAMKAYFSYINARRGPDGKRGVYGRQIIFKYYDDGYNPANSVQLTRKLVEEDKVFAVVGSLGTEVNEAIQPYLNEKKVPHVLSSTGASEFGLNYVKYPWSIGWQPDYVGEGRIYGLDIVKNHTTAKIGDHLPERQLREGLPLRLQVGARQGEEPDRRRGAVRGDVAHPGRRGGQAEGVRRRHARHLRHPEGDDPDVRVRQGARLGAKRDLRHLGLGHDGLHDNCQPSLRVICQQRAQRRLRQGSGEPPVRQGSPRCSSSRSCWPSTPLPRTRTKGSTSTGSRRRRPSCTRSTRPARTRRGRR